MQITTEALTNAMRPAADILRGKPTTDAPRYLKIEAAKNRLTLSANDNNQSSITEVPCDGDLKPMCVTFFSLQNIMPLFNDKVTMEAHGTQLRIKSNGNYMLNIIDPKEFVEIKTDKMPKVAVNCADLAECIDRVKFASRREDSRVTLYGAGVILSAKKMTVKASTGLVFARMEKASIAADAEFMVPYPFIQNTISALRNPGAVLSVSDNRISVAFDGGMYACSLLGVKFPTSYNGMETAKRSALGSFKPLEWLPIFRSIYAMAGEDGKVRCDVVIENGRAKFEGKQGSVDTKITKLAKRIKVNAATFIDCLEVFGDAEVKSSVTPDSAFMMEQGELLVATTQLRD